MEDEDFKKTTGYLFSFFKTTFNSKLLKRLIDYTTEEIYRLISKEVDEKLISIMFDSGSRHGRNVFSVSIRYMNEKKVKERTLGMLTQIKSQTGKSLSSQIQELLLKIGKSANDVYIMCSDGGANMKLTSKLIQDAQSSLP